MIEKDIEIRDNFIWQVIFMLVFFTLFCTGAKKNSKNDERTGWNKHIQDGKEVKN